MLEPGIQDKSRWWTREDVILLILMGALFLLPGVGRIPLFDRDEPRFAVAARTMSQTGDYIVPRFNGALRPDKPPLVYWLMDVTSWACGWAGGAAGAGELGVRLPSTICATLTLIVVYFMTGARFGRVTGLIAAMILGSCALFVVVSRMATADATMIFCIVTAMACAWQAWDAARPDAQNPAAGHLPRTDYLVDRSPEKPEMVLDRMGPAAPRRMPRSMAALFWTALAAGALTKGVPLAFVLIPMLTLSIFTRQWRWWRQLRPAWGIPLLLVLAGWWIVWAGVATDWRLINDMIGTHFLSRVAGPLLRWLGVHLSEGGGQPGNDPMNNYGRPPGFFLLTVWATFWPWSVLLIPVAYHTVKRLRGKTALAIDPRPYQFLVAWIVPMWLVLELSRGKLPHYPLPLFVPLAILCADTLVQSWHRLTDVLAAPWVKGMRWLILLIWCGLGTAVLVGGYRYLEREVFWMCVPFGGALLATGVATAIAWGRPGWPFVTVLAWGGSLLCASSLLLPDLPPLQVSRLAGRRMAEIKKAEPDFHLAAAGYTEGSLVFYAGGDLPLFSDVDDLLEAVPFSAEESPPPQRKFIVAVDDAALHALEQRRVRFYPVRLARFAGVDAAASFRHIAVSIVTNAPLTPETLPAPATNPTTLPPNWPK